MRHIQAASRPVHGVNRTVFFVNKPILVVVEYRPVRVPAGRDEPDTGRHSLFINLLGGRFHPVRVGAARIVIGEVTTAQLPFIVYLQQIEAELCQFPSAELGKLGHVFFVGSAAVWFGVPCAIAGWNFGQFYSVSFCDCPGVFFEPDQCIVKVPDCEHFASGVFARLDEQVSVFAPCIDTYGVLGWFR